MSKAENLAAHRTALVACEAALAALFEARQAFPDTFEARPCLAEVDAARTLMGSVQNKLVIAIYHGERVPSP